MTVFAYFFFFFFSWVFHSLSYRQKLQRIEYAVINTIFTIHNTARHSSVVHMMMILYSDIPIPFSYLRNIENMIEVFCFSDFHGNKNKDCGVKFLKERRMNPSHISTCSILPVCFFM